jgi:hypothetical protein
MLDVFAVEFSVLKLFLIFDIKIFSPLKIDNFNCMVTKNQPLFVHQKKISGQPLLSQKLNLIQKHPHFLTKEVPFRLPQLIFKQMSQFQGFLFGVIPLMLLVWALILRIQSSLAFFTATFD